MCVKQCGVHLPELVTDVMCKVLFTSQVTELSASPLYFIVTEYLQYTGLDDVGKIICLCHFCLCVA